MRSWHFASQDFGLALDVRLLQMRVEWRGELEFVVKHQVPRLYLQGDHARVRVFGDV